MASLTDQEMTALEKIVCYITHSKWKGHAIPWGGGPHGEAPGLVRSQRRVRSEEKMCAREETGEAG